ncbi:hypothetical protein QQX09_10230 [Demequina sp. SYSU T00192]|uniref:Uncharacterized protein n=1 Tax=Demequina litoralis TaxID=3051660 RepID=A0ABT8GAR4_9MICO|nr:hypothetical protein [Demequina sp. SYSU T00192]MDN4476231.1 hypothetical protein [Demequina sp. SYSU T00192]
MTIRRRPLVDQLKPALVDRDLNAANSIPKVEASKETSDVPGVAKVRLRHSVLATDGDVLPWAAPVQVIAGALVHPRRLRAMIVARELIMLIGAAGSMAFRGTLDEAPARAASAAPEPEAVEAISRPTSR